MNRLLLLGAALAALLVAPAASAAKTDCYAAGAPVCVRAAVLGAASTAGSFKPGRLNTVEYTVPIVKITWSSWTATKAVGRGRLLKCGTCDPTDLGPAVTVTLQRPITYFCGPSEEESQPIGTWFTRAKVSSAILGTHTRKIVADGHPNAC